MHETEKDRTMVFMGSIEDQSTKELTEKIKRLIDEDREGWITLYIKSEGGDPVAAFGIYEYVVCVLKPKLRTIVLGECSSASLLLFLMGEHRIIGSYACLQLHEFGRSWDKPIRLSCSALERIVEDTQKDQEKYAEIAKDRTEGKITKEGMLKLMKTKTRIDPPDAVRLGLAHEILK